MRRLPFVVALLVTTYLFLTPLDEPPPGPENSDKVVHALLFCVLTLLGAYARVPLVPLAVGLIAYAVGTETLQSVLPIHRFGDVADGIADVAGIGLGLLLVRLPTSRRRGGRPSRSNPPAPRAG